MIDWKKAIYGYQYIDKRYIVC